MDIHHISRHAKGQDRTTHSPTHLCRFECGCALNLTLLWDRRHLLLLLLLKRDATVEKKKKDLIQFLWWNWIPKVIVMKCTVYEGRASHPASQPDKLPCIYRPSTFAPSCSGPVIINNNTTTSSSAAREPSLSGVDTIKYIKWEAVPGTLPALAR